MARIEHFAIFATDLVPLSTFYQQTFGMRVVLDNSKAPVPGHFLADDAGAVIEIIERPKGMPAADTRYACHAAFWVDDYPSARARIEARGVAFETDTEVNTDAFRTGFFNDPQGNRCQIVWRAKPLGT